MSDKSSAVNARAGVLRAMSNPRRLEALALLIQNEYAVGVLANKLGISQSALSQHLLKLREAGLIEFRRDAQSVFYRCESPIVADVLAAIEKHI